MLKVNNKSIDKHEIYRMLPVIGTVAISLQNNGEATDYIGNKKYMEIAREATQKNSYSLAAGMYHYLLESEEYGKLEDYFELSLSYSVENTITILDAFCVNDLWLTMMKESLERVGGLNVHLIANGLESDTVDECYNKPLKDLIEIPKNSISLLLFNPPSNGLQHLQAIIENDFLYSASFGVSGKMIMVLDKNELKELLPLLLEYLEVNEELVYKTRVDESGESKFVVYATKRNKKLDLQSDGDKDYHRERINIINQIINNDPEYSLDVFSAGIHRELATVPYGELKENHSFLQDGGLKLSSFNGSGWDWIKKNTTIDEMDKVSINKPTPLKAGEVANIIASGMIDGEMSLSDGRGFHVVSGGTKQQIKQELIQEYSRDGSIKNKTRTLLYSQPYLNILINENGRLKIKELQGGVELE